eukprot:gnl/Dysnectes_brevis/939_a1045_3109.p1 GENE.gnl/Dysnectes_brevis/939_a1045_3109~~gnl/Dysnectes_brevis/939_a1045_3109.p1  ORF type:complete len:820 (+),score=91.58 gnl/Dysnectes_brevis/939_a1045_3109:66-2525(+)
MITLFILLAISLAYSYDLCYLESNTLYPHDQVLDCMQSVTMTAQQKTDLFLYLEEVVDSYALKSINMQPPIAFEATACDLKAELKRLEAETDLNQFDIHYGLNTIFGKLQDGHTVYIMPTDLLVLSILPIVPVITQTPPPAPDDQTNDNDNDDVITTPVTTVSLTLNGIWVEYFDLFPNQLAQATDAVWNEWTLESINNMDPLQYLLEVGTAVGMTLSPGGSFNNGVWSMNYRYGILTPAVGETVDFVFDNGETLSLPWSGVAVTTSVDLDQRQEMNNGIAPTPTSGDTDSDVRMPLRFDADDLSVSRRGHLVKVPQTKPDHIAAMLRPANIADIIDEAINDSETETETDEKEVLPVFWLESVANAYIYTDKATHIKTGIIRFPAFTTPYATINRPDLSWMTRIMDIFEEHDPDFIVLDLRHNGGGDAAMLSPFLWLLGSQRGEFTTPSMVVPHDSVVNPDLISDFSTFTFASHSNVKEDDFKTQSFTVDNTYIDDEYSSFGDTQTTVTSQHDGYLSFVPVDFYDRKGRLDFPAMWGQKDFIEYQPWKTFSANEIAVLSDGYCYSGCSMLSLMIKERGIGSIITLGGVPDVVNGGSGQNIVGGASGGAVINSDDFSAYFERSPPFDVSVNFLWSLLLSADVPMDMETEAPTDPESVTVSDLYQYTQIEADHSIPYWPVEGQYDSIIYQDVMPHVTRIMLKGGNTVRDDIMCADPDNNPNMVYGRVQTDDIFEGDCIPIYCGDRSILTDRANGVCSGQTKSKLFKVTWLIVGFVSMIVVLLLLVVGAVFLCCCCCRRRRRSKARAHNDNRRLITEEDRDC